MVKSPASRANICFLSIFIRTERGYSELKNNISVAIFALVELEDAKY
jgi:hypothetical protein